MVYLDTTRKTVKHLRSKASKKPNKRQRVLVSVYDATNDDIVATWLRLPYMMDCPILKTCAECGRCKLK